MTIFKLVTKSDRVELPIFHFLEKRTLEATVEAISGLLSKDNDLKWEAEEISVMTHEEAMLQFMEIMT